mmetsp:Transcript_105683/g.203016  ORF Transcript_105683/g.203016 Transcript_105683/m.203016 type:complete len:373 (-) Transcript_105683:145-1263(-)
MPVQKRLQVLHSHLLEAASGVATSLDSELDVLASPVGLSLEYEDHGAIPARRRVRLSWKQPIRRVLFVKKWGDERVAAVAREIVAWLVAHGVSVLTEEADVQDYEESLGVFALDPSRTRKAAVDLVVTLGGDGTLLHASRLFRFLDRGVDKLLPPCLVLGMGSLGFLATCPGKDWQRALTSALRGHLDPLPCTLRTRLRCQLHLESSGSEQCNTWHALNEVVVLSRGTAIGKLRLLVDGSFVTLVEGDGLIISSPTGSTGYSLSSGGPILSPSVPATLLTPIAPASLSFRPVLISEMSTVEVQLPAQARIGEASVLLDGRHMGNLERGGSVIISVARPIPVINVAGLDRDWFEAITNKLKWNVRDVEQADLA